MKITRKEDEKNIMLYNVLQPGECFQFLDDEELYLKTTGSFSVSLDSGQLVCDSGRENKLVRSINDIELIYSYK